MAGLVLYLDSMCLALIHLTRTMHPCCMAASCRFISSQIHDTLPPSIQIFIPGDIFHERRRLQETTNPPRQNAEQDLDKMKRNRGILAACKTQQHRPFRLASSGLVSYDACPPSSPIPKPTTVGKLSQLFRLSPYPTLKLPFLL
jgi:hypothetical protein